MERLLLQAPPGELAAVTDCVRNLCPDADAAALQRYAREHHLAGFFVADVPGGGKARRAALACGHACPEARRASLARSALSRVRSTAPAP